VNGRGGGGGVVGEGNIIVEAKNYTSACDVILQGGLRSTKYDGEVYAFFSQLLLY